jgi:pimeloyl-ACP methyl ester carboxylesterase
MKLLAVAILPWLVSLGAHAQAPTVSKTGETRGLTAKFVDVNAFGTNIGTRYYEMGEGEPMVLVHGGGFDGRYSANHWDKVIPGLGERFHVFAPDKLAAGMTDNPPDDENLNIQGEVEHMYRFIQTMKLGQVHLVGQSRGAGLALLFAVTHPEVVKTLVLIDSGTATPEDACPGCSRIARDPCPTGDPDEYWQCLMRNLCFQAAVAFDDEYWAAGNYMATLPKARATVARKAAGAGGPGSNGFVDGVAWEEYKKTLHERLRNEALLQMPVLLYWAVNDPQAPALKNGVALYDILTEKHPNTRMMIVNKAGHFWWREHPDEFTYGLIGFIDYWNR